MRKLIITLALFFAYYVINAQFINNGATITVQPGSTLRIESDFQNNGTGTVTNNGTIEVMGNFTNASSATLTPSVGLIKFIGTGNSNLNTGGDALNNVEMAKTTANGTVTLVSATDIGGNLSFTGTGNNRILLGNFDLTLSNSAATVSATTDHPTNGWVVSDKTGVNTGKFVKNIASGSSTRTLELGDDTNYSPVSMVLNASSAGTIAARVLTSNLTAKYAETTDYISREWVVSTTNVTSNTLTGTYVAGDITGTQSLIKGATYHTGDWRFDGSSGSGNTVTASTTTADVRLSGMNFFGKVNLKAFLQGAYSSGSMTTTLNTNNLIPLTSPYTDAPATVTSIPSGVTDWIKLELRDPANPGVPTSNKASAFIKSDGTLVGLDGTSLPRIKNGYATSVIAVFHRNHLPFRSNVGIDVVNPSLEDFTITNTKLFDNGSDNAPLNTVSSILVMWPCDASGSTYLVNSTDLGFVKSQTATIPTGYLRADVNLNGIANSTDLGMTKANTAVPKAADL